MGGKKEGLGLLSPTRVQKTARQGRRKRLDYKGKGVPPSGKSTNWLFEDLHQSRGSYHGKKEKGK